MKTTLREMKPQDVPAVLARLREQNERDGTSYPMPRVFDANGVRLAGIPLALVAVDEAGAVVQGCVTQRTCEMMIFGTNPDATKSSLEEQQAVFYILRQRGYEDVHVLVPEQIAARLCVKLGEDLGMGMMGTGEQLRHYYRRLDPAENDALLNWREGLRAAVSEQSEETCHV